MVRSSLRRQMGIEMEGPDALQHFITVHFYADLSGIGDKWILHWIMEPSASGTQISYDDGQNWVLMAQREANSMMRRAFGSD